MSKKEKKDPALHEREYIDYLEKQLAWLQKQDSGVVSKADIVKIKYKLAKARLILNLLEKK